MVMIYVYVVVSTYEFTKSKNWRMYCIPTTLQRENNAKIKKSKLVYLADWAAAVSYFHTTHLQCVQTKTIKKLVSDVIF